MTILPANSDAQQSAAWLDTFWCAVYTVLSLSIWPWLYWDMTYRASGLP